MDTVYLVDGTGYVFRAFHAIRPMRNAAGTPIHAVLGFTRMLLKLIKEHHPREMAVVFDAGRDTFRLGIYPEYKATRDQAPEDIRVQLPLCAEVVDALGITRVQKPGVEADDVLGTLARQAHEAGKRVIIVTGDKDLMQLVGKDIQILRYNSRTETEEVVDVAGVKDRFGVAPSQVIDVLALMGDTSDNVPGVDGIGEKTAMELVAQHGSVEGVLAAAPSMKAGKRRDTLLAQADRARLSKTLVTLRLDVPLDGVVDLGFKGVTVMRAREFFARMGFKALLSDPMFAPPSELPLASLPPPPASETPATPAPAATAESARDVGAWSTAHHQLINTEHELAQLVATCREAGTFSLASVHDGDSAMTGTWVALALCSGPGRSGCVVVARPDELIPRGMPSTQVKTAFAGLLGTPGIRVLGHHAKETFKLLAQMDIPPPRLAGDSMLGSYVLARGELHDLTTVAEQVLHITLPSEQEVRGKGKSATPWRSVDDARLASWLNQQADASFQACRKLEPLLRDEGLHELYAGLELPLSDVLTRMEMAGVQVQVDTLRTLSTEMRQDCARLEAEAHHLAGEAFNLASPKQLAEVLFGKLQLPVLRKTKTGPSTDVDVLEELAPMHPLPAKVLEHRQLMKLVGTYLDALPALVHPRTGRIHTTFHQAVAATGRLSSQDPNLQNIPIRDPRGRKIRSAFVAPPGKLLLSADYSQIELRILAHVSEDPVLLEAFARGEDVHARTASEILGIALADVTKDQRRAAKTINFGLLYGMSAFGLSQALKIPRAEAKDYLERYYARLSGVAAWQEKTLVEAKARGFVTTMFGRRRFLPGLADRNHAVRQGAERMAINTPIQGAAADIIKRAMVTLDGALTSAGSHARMILQVHDELLLEVESAHLKATEELVRHAMESAASLRVKLEVQVGHGADWGEAHGG